MDQKRKLIVAFCLGYICCGVPTLYVLREDAKTIKRLRQSGNAVINVAKQMLDAVQLVEPYLDESRIPTQVQQQLEKILTNIDFTIITERYDR